MAEKQKQLPDGRYPDDERPAPSPGRRYPTEAEIKKWDPDGTQYAKLRMLQLWDKGHGGYQGPRFKADRISRYLRQLLAEKIDVSGKKVTQNYLIAQALLRGTLLISKKISEGTKVTPQELHILDEVLDRQDPKPRRSEIEIVDEEAPRIVRPPFDFPKEPDAETTGDSGE